MTITDEQRAAWQALADRASRGPWDTVLSSDDGVCVAADDGRDGIAGELLVDDARFIAAARDAVPALLAALRDAEAERDSAVQVMADHRCGDQAERAYERACNAEAALARVREVHADELGPDGVVFVCSTCGVPVETEPCPTIRALDGTETKETPCP